MEEASSHTKEKNEKRRLLRGGSWDSSPWNCRSAYRNLNQPSDVYDPVCFRVVSLPPGPFP
jgi:formylglycine-generating enzyme required for sulfatase activity